MIRKPRPRLQRQAEGGLGRSPALRLLPIVIVAAICMLGFRLQVVVKEIANTTTASVFFERAVAFAAAQPAAPAAPEAPAETAAETATAEAPATDTSTAEPGEPGAPAEAEPLPLPVDGSTFTRQEVETLQLLADRRAEIDERDKEVSAREGLLKAAEVRIDDKIGQLQTLEKTIQGLLQQYDAKKQEEIDQLVRIYAAMKPKDAARIFDSLEMPILVSVVQNMATNRVAPIMSEMDAAKATALTEELTARRQLPGAAALN